MTVRTVLIVVFLLLTGCHALDVTGTPTATETASSTEQIETAATTEADRTETPTPEYAGYVEAVRVETVPENATIVSANDSALRELDIVRSAIEDAARNGQQESYVTAAELDAIRDRYPTDHVYEDDGFGLYVSYRNAQIRVRLVGYV